MSTISQSALARSSSMFANQCGIWCCRANSSARRSVPENTAVTSTSGTNRRYDSRWISPMNPAPSSATLVFAIFRLYANRSRTRSPILQHVAHTADRVDELRGERIVHLGPQAPDVDVDEICVALEIDVPHLVGNVGSREDFARLPHQQREQQK